MKGVKRRLTSHSLPGIQGVEFKDGIRYKGKVLPENGVINAATGATNEKQPMKKNACNWYSGMSLFAAAVVLFLLSTGSPASASMDACPKTERVIDFGFYAYFEPVSYSAVSDPAAPGFDDHRGYEAALLTALEHMEGVNLSLRRHGIAPWGDIWLRPAGSEFEIVGGGITIRESRTRDATGKQVVMFTRGHIEFRQSLLVRSEDAESLSSYNNLNDAIRIGVVRGTTGEARLLELTGYINTDGILASGVRVDTPDGMIVSDGSEMFGISAAEASPDLVDRMYLHPASPTMPQVIYLADEVALLNALREETIDGIARGDIGNRHAAHASSGAFTVGAVDDSAEFGGFVVAAEDAGLATCINTAIDWLTDSGRIGYALWLENPAIFKQRARTWGE